MKTKLRLLPKVIRIDWVDSHSSQGWCNQDEVDKHAPGIISTIGWVVNESKYHITLTAHLSRESDTYPAHAIMSIPKCSILKIRKIPRDYLSL